ncbi:MAG: immunoglobulin domain-containing protein [Chitinispirillaceae bacterium]|nr:immunoglobulin domain-containing protein [Chitinispirillaceae bacterium]
MIRPIISRRVLLLAVTIICTMFCNLPPDLSDPSNTSITPFITSTDGKTYKESLWDTAGKPVNIGAALFLPVNINSINLKITRDTQLIFDTLFQDYIRDSFKDTLLKTFTFFIPGKYQATFTPKTALSLEPVSISFVMLASENHKPEIEIKGTTTVKPGETCALAVISSDPDSGQVLTMTVKGQPYGSTFLNGSFFWAVPLNFTGYDTLVFAVTDNGNPPLSAEKQVILTVTAPPENNAPKWSDDTLMVLLNDTSAYSLNLAAKCTDSDGDSLSWLLLQQDSLNDSIKNGAYLFRATPASAGTHYPAIIATDPSGASDTLFIKLTIQLLPSSRVELASIGFSSGTLPGKSAPVPDTLYDTVSFNDSLISISFTLWDTTTAISVNGMNLPDDSTATTVLLSAGSNVAEVTLNAADNSISKTYHITIVRKQNSVEPLTTPPTGLIIDSIFTTYVTLRWSDITNATSYTVERSKGTAAAFSVAGSVNSNCLSDTGLEQGTIYFYRVSASNAAGSTSFSTPLEVKTWKEPVITKDLEPVLVITEGQPLTLSVTATGTPECTYQWKKNDTEIEGATSNVFEINPAYQSNSGVYMVVVRNGVRTITSKQSKVEVVPSYTLSTISSPAPGGSVSRSKDTTVYSSGSIVTLTTAAAVGYRFNGWTGDTTGTSNPLVITMTKNKTLFANFVRQYTLTLTASSPARGTVDPASAVMVDSGATFTIKAAPSNGYTFKKWSTSSAGVTIVDTLALTTNVRLAGGNATIQAVFGCVTFAKQLKLSQYPDLNLVDVVQTEDGGYMAISSDQTLIKLDYKGDTVFVKKVYISIPSSIYPTKNGYIISGVDSDQGSVAVHAQNGNLLWSNYLGNDTQSTSFNITMIANNDGYICGGRVLGDFYFVKTDGNGNKIWENTSTAWGGLVTDCRPTRDGGYIVAGPAGQGFGGLLVKQAVMELLNGKMTFDLLYFQNIRSIPFLQ